MDILAAFFGDTVQTTRNTLYVECSQTKPTKQANDLCEGSQSGIESLSVTGNLEGTNFNVPNNPFTGT